MATLEELITNAVIATLKKKDEEEVVKIGVSARHVHLNRKDLDALFGEGYELTKKKELMGGQFAAEECVTITIALGYREGNLMISFAPTLDMYVVGREEWVWLSIGSHLDIEGVTSLFSLVNTKLASLSCFHPFVVVVGGVENLLTFIVYIFRVPLISIH